MLEWELKNLFEERTESSGSCITAILMCKGHCVSANLGEN